MNLRDIAEIAVLTAWFGQTRNEATRPLSESFLKDFWRSSQQRCHLWHQDHIRYCKKTSLEESIHLLEEIVVSEMLTRVMIGVMCFNQSDNYKQFGDRVLEHEHKLKHMLFIHCNGDKESIAERLRLERLQRRVERWSDLLVSPFLQNDSSNNFASNKLRTEEFANAGIYQNRITSPGVELSVFLSSARLVIPNRDITVDTRSSAQQNMLNLSLTLLPPEICDDQGPRPRMMQTISNSHAYETQPTVSIREPLNRLS